jgi:Tfp pilus assembly protein PilE
MLRGQMITFLESMIVVVRVTNVLSLATAAYATAVANGGASTASARTIRAMRVARNQHHVDGARSSPMCPERTAKGMF